MQNLDIYFRKNHDRHLKTINKILYSSRETAEDIVQEAYLKAYKYMDTYDPERSEFNTWFNKILFNTLRDYQRDFKNAPEMVDLDVNMCIDDNKYDFNLDTHKSLEESIDRIKNKRHRKFLILYYILGYSAREIAETEDTTVTNITTICSRFKQTLE